MKKLKILSVIALALIILITPAFGAWDKTKPADDELKKDVPAICRANWEALELGTDLALQITNAKVAAGAAITDTKLAQITTANKVSGTALTSLTSVPAGAGALPVANIPTSIPDSKLSQLTTADKVANSALATITAAGKVDGAAITNCANIPSGAGKIPVANIDTGTTANKIVQLDANAKLPAVDGSALINMPLGSGRQVFTSDGTFTVPEGVTTLYITGIGGGGGGGGGGSGSSAGAGGGGENGHALINYPFAVTPEDILTVTIGQGGTGGAGVGGNNPGYPGTDGTATSIGSCVMAGGDHGNGGLIGGGEQGHTIALGLIYWHPTKQYVAPSLFSAGSETANANGNGYGCGGTGGQSQYTGGNGTDGILIVAW